ncbi:MAG: c-type cytochrome [Gammaproteobacteria bacterium]|nr:MAG: c-type cytochrome [Gammaproteobacteria bacterium]
MPSAPFEDLHVSCRSIGILLLIALSAECAHAQTARTPELLAQARALAADAEHGKILYLKHCTGCHGHQAWGDGPKQIPALAGQREFYVLRQLARFAARERDSSLMQESIHPADVNRPQAFRDLAAYLAQASRSPRSDHGDGRALGVGERTYRGCIACHDQSAEGSDGAPIPAIGGQHYYYVLHRLQSFPTLHEGRVETDVLRLVAALSPDEQQGLADYTSRLTALTAAGAAH